MKSSVAVDETEKRGPGRPRTTGRGAGERKVVFVSLSQEEHADATRAAQRTSQPLATWIRGMVLRATKRSGAGS